MSAAVPQTSLQISESDWQQRVIDLARVLGWRVHHGRPALTGRGWRTPVQGHPGYVDLTLARPGRLILAELKTTTGLLGPEQRAWLAVLRTVPGIEVFVWRPTDWDQVVRILSEDRAVTREENRRLTEASES